jgi:sec-independent protein translocase protein TatC
MRQPRPRNNERVMTLLEHIGELRTRILRSVGWVVLAGAAAYAFTPQLYALLIAPLHRAAPDLQLHYFSATEPFFVTLRIAITAGLIIAAPLVLLELWGFVAPGLTPAERRAALPVLPVLILLFGSGVWFVYTQMLPVSIGFLLGLAQPGIAPMLDQQQYFAFIGGLCLGGGLLFELPAVLGLLGALGFISAGWLWRNTGIALIVLMILAAVITPTGDAFTMLLLTAPLMALYFLSIGVVWAVQRRARQGELGSGKPS